VLSGLLPLLSLLLATPARAELGVSATVTSDFRYRGVSLSDDKPAASMTITYDHPSGLYVGVSGIAALTARDGARPLGYQTYLGYAGRLGPGVSWDAGVARTDLTLYIKPRYRVRYNEIYAGVAAHDVSVHVYYAPNYLGEGIRTVYVDVSGAKRLSETVRLFGHVGLLTPLHPQPDAEINRPQLDVRAGVAARLKGFDLQMAWTRFGPNREYPAGNPQRRDAVIVSATHAF
jgi:uncharacterized protein (TIGR02001 family)